MLYVRAAGPGDLEALMDLAILSGPGFTSLPEDEAVLGERLALSEASFAGRLAPQAAWYTLMLIDAQSGAVEGVAAVKAAVGLQRPHFSFRVVTLAQYSSAVATRFDHRALLLVNECGGWTEVGSLFLRPERRGAGGAGALLSRARYMLIGAQPDRFADTVMAELRGWFEEDGSSPFWDGFASPFYRIPFSEADYRIAATDGQFILDLAPRHLVYVEMMQAQAREAIGRVHRDGEGARALLEREGFQPSGLIDIFDGGPTYRAPKDGISTIARARNYTTVVGDPLEDRPALVSRPAIDGFRAVRTPFTPVGERAIISTAAAEALEVKPGDIIRISA
ncbi:arginine N-succinyltransferase [Brevundimonas sp.]|jgi:arginine N-succinyltransferase|uniref:arginine N-succinyltransferase n=1 Tax=Brevundimonas sp. TaxID=1871086 RepID=UPI0037C00C91